jgi:hypothetical protein
MLSIISLEIVDSLGRIMNCAEKSLISYAQKRHFHEELEYLEKGKKNLKLCSKLNKLDPFIDSDALAFS